MAPNKKYLSLEEAAEQLGIKTEELIRLREKGEIRGFADRGTWKFKAEEVVEFRRRHHPDSDPDLPIVNADDDDEDMGRQATVIRRGKEIESDSDVRVSGLGDSKKSRLTGSSDEIGVINPQASDSDVRLADAPLSLKPDSDSDVMLVKPNRASSEDSDSDVKIIDLPLESPDSDSDVKLLTPSAPLRDSDSDVKLAASDSDVRLAPLIDSDSDVKLINRKSSQLKSDSDSDVALLPRDSRESKTSDINALTVDLPDPKKESIDFDLSGIDQGGSVLLDADDSAISLAGDSGIQLAGDSGIQLASDSGAQLKGDSGIRLAGLSGIRLGGDSGIRFSDDSGVQLKQPADSGISLEGRDSGSRLADSGISLGEDSELNFLSTGSSMNLKGSSKNLKGSSNKLKGGSSKKLKGSSNKMKAQPKAQSEDDLGETSPLLLSGIEDDDDYSSTSPLLSAAGSDDDVSPSDLDLLENTDTLEVPNDESGQNVVMFDDDEEEAPVARKRAPKSAEENIFEMDDSGDEELEELEVSDEDLSDESDLDSLAFDDDSDDDEGFAEGASHIGRGSPQKVTVAQEVEWSAGTCALLFTSMCVLVIGALVSSDLLHAVWNQGLNPSDNQRIASLMAGLWK